MKLVHINLITKNPNLEIKYLSDLINKCSSKKYSVILHIMDYSLDSQNSKNLSEIEWDVGKPIVNFVKLDYENMENYKLDILNILEKEEEGNSVFIKMSESVQLEDGFIDELGVDFLDDENYGSCYSDFYVDFSDDDEPPKKVAHFHKSVPTSINILPIVVISTGHFLSNYTEDNVEGYILSNFISHHVCKPLATIKG